MSERSKNTQIESIEFILCLGSLVLRLDLGDSFYEYKRFSNSALSVRMQVPNHVAISIYYSKNFAVFLGGSGV